MGNDFPDMEGSNRPLERDELITKLASAGVLTERQSEVWVLRSIEDVPRADTADALGITINTVDNTVTIARGKIRAARDTVEILDDVADRLTKAESDPMDSAGAYPGFSSEWKARNESDDVEPEADDWYADNPDWADNLPDLSEGDK